MLVGLNLIFNYVNVLVNVHHKRPLWMNLEGCGKGCDEGEVR